MVVRCFVGGRQIKKSKAFIQPMRITRKSSSNASDEGDEGSSFGNIMYMMMMQHKSDSKQREWEYQLHWEEIGSSRPETNDEPSVHADAD
jgi:hypothetical protein